MEISSSNLWEKSRSLDLPFLPKVQQHPLYMWRRCSTHTLTHPLIMDKLNAAPRVSQVWQVHMPNQKQLSVICLTTVTLTLHVGIKLIKQWNFSPIAKIHYMALAFYTGSNCSGEGAHIDVKKYQRKDLSMWHTAFKWVTLSPALPSVPDHFLNHCCWFSTEQ